MSNSDINDTEVQWRKAARSTGSGEDCVEIASIPQTIAVRDSKDPLGPKLAFNQAELAAFFTSVRQGNYDL